MDQKNNLRTNGDRLWDSLMQMAKIGPGVAGGNNRQALTDEDSEGRHLFKRWCKQADMTVSVDKMGSMFATRQGTDPDALPVYVGSHLDTQPTGGKYDGILGVLAGLEIVRTLNETGVKTKRPIVIVNFTNEEGTRFESAKFFRLHHHKARVPTGQLPGLSKQNVCLTVQWRCQGVNGGLIQDFESRIRSVSPNWPST